MPILKNYTKYDSSNKGIRDLKHLFESPSEPIIEKPIFNQNIIESKIQTNKLNKLYEKAVICGTEMAFAEELYNIYESALVLDESFIDENRNTIKLFFFKKLDEETDHNLYNAMNIVKNNSPYLKELVEKCKKVGESKCKKIKEKCKKCKDSEDNKIEEIYNSIMNDKDVYGDDINNESCCKSKKDLDPTSQEAANIIKDKVVKVVAAEEECNKKKKKLMEELNQAKEENDVNEAARLENEIKNFGYSLFNTLMINNSKEAISEACKTGESNNYALLDESTGEVNLDMDMIMMDAILEYTNLEVYNTLKLKKYSNKDIYDMCLQ